MIGFPPGSAQLRPRSFGRAFSEDPPSVRQSAQKAAQEFDPVEVAAQVAPVAAKFLSKTADEDAEVLKAKIANWRSWKKRFPLGSSIADAQIRKLQARLRSAGRARAIESEGIAATRQWRALGQGVLVVTILVGGAAVVRLLRRSGG